MEKISSDDLQFVTDTKEAMVHSFPLAAHLILWITVAFFSIALLWAAFASLDEVTSGDGKVIPSSELQVVQNMEGGILKELRVREGDIVDKGQILAVIDDTRFSSNLRESEVRRYGLEARVARLSAELDNREPVFSAELTQTAPTIAEDELALFRSRRDEMTVSINILRDQLQERIQEHGEAQAQLRQLKRSHDLLKKEMDLTRPLVSKGVVSKVEFLRLEREYAQTRGDLESTILAVQRLQAAVDGAKRRIQEEEMTAQTAILEELNAARREFSELKEAGRVLEDRLDRTLVRSPMKGTVNQVKRKTLGGVLEPGEDLIEIVPFDDTLLVEARIRPKDIGGLSPGLEGTVKISAYDFSVHGGLKARLEHISADTVTDERGETFYVILVRTESSVLEGKNGKALPIMPGMQATVDILTGEKTVLEYLLKPFKKAQHKAMREK